MADVVADSKFAGLLDSLRVEDASSGKRGFKTYRDIMKFAAMVGFECSQRQRGDGKGKVVPLRIFESSKDQHLIWLIALLAEEDVEILRKDEYGDQEDRAIGVFEDYVNGGLEEISTWVITRAPDDYMSEIIDRVNARIQAEVDVSNEDITFE